MISIAGRAVAPPPILTRRTGGPDGIVDIGGSSRDGLAERVAITGGAVAKKRSIARGGRSAFDQCLGGQAQRGNPLPHAMHSLTLLEIIPCPTCDHSLHIPRHVRTANIVETWSVYWRYTSVSPIVRGLTVEFSYNAVLESW